MMTDSGGNIFSERRYEPFGVDIDTYAGPAGGLGPSSSGVDFRTEPTNILNKQSDPDTSWSYHGARWVSPQTARWHTPDPIVKAPDGKFMAKPWRLHPYQYAAQNPVIYWDPDGRDVVIFYMGNKDDTVHFRKEVAERLKADLVSYAEALKDDRVHVVSYSQLEDTVRDIEDQGRTVSVLVGYGHGSSGARMYPANDGPYTKSKYIGEIAEDAHLAVGGVFISNACVICSDTSTFTRFERQGINFAGFSGWSTPLKSGRLKYTPILEDRNPDGKNSRTRPTSEHVPTHGTMPRNTSIGRMIFDTVATVEGAESFTSTKNSKKYRAMRETQRRRVKQDSEDAPKR